jgi:phage tail-like protein
MPKPPVDPRRLSSDTQPRFHIKWNGRIVATATRIDAIDKMTGLKKPPGIRDAIISRDVQKRSQRGAVSLDDIVIRDQEFAAWAAKSWSLGGGLGPERRLKDPGKDITIEVLDGEGRKTAAYKAYGCWVSEYQALPDLDASANAVAIEHIKLENEGWERDDEPTEPNEAAIGSNHR